ncbi:orcokinin isoform X2 [Bombyx mori]|uniref:Orcokinin type IV n=1 Tax=Bombyx mori TaxID=7091 RepID=A0A3Q9DR97_BOMMO|nr:orcokinin isoform X2 [Bombyx mori]AZQ00681.1 orcokinin type IV [Bombyx mori]
MRGTAGVLAVAVAALLVCCSADPHQEQDVSGNDHTSGERYDAAGHKTRNLDPLGGGNLVRDVREARHSGYLPYQMFRRYDYISPYGKREPWPLVPAEYGGYYGDGFPKRNFDEIDRSSLNTFVKKRNFDEIDRSSMPFPYAIKRFYHLYGQNFLDIDSPVSSFDKKRYRPDYPMDEIDLSHFPVGSKRSQDSYPLASNL